MSKRAKVWAKQRRVRLIAELGGVCVECGENDYTKLTFDHIYGKDWETTGMSTDQRMLRYVKEAEQKLLQILCHSCNSKRGNPREKELRKKVRALTLTGAGCAHGCTAYVGDLELIHTDPKWSLDDVADYKVAAEKISEEVACGRLTILCPDCYSLHESNVCEEVANPF